MKNPNIHDTMLSHEVLNYILSYLSKSIISSMPYEEIIKPKYPDLTRDEALVYFDKLAGNGFINQSRHGYGLNLNEITITSDGTSFITSGGYSRKKAKHKNNKISDKLMLYLVYPTIVGIIVVVFTAILNKCA